MLCLPCSAGHLSWNLTCFRRDLITVIKTNCECTSVVLLHLLTKGKKITGNVREGDLTVAAVTHRKKMNKLLRVWTRV